MVCMSFFNSFGDPCPLCKYDLLKENSPPCLLHDLLDMDLLFIFYLLKFYLHIFDINYNMYKFL
jgi:hypothetical protein